MTGRDNPHHERRWLILSIIGIAQLMVVLDATIVNIALPSAQADLGFSDDSRQWIITAYALAFGSLLLLGGRLGDLFGRKWAFVGGLVGFSVASAIGGAAESFGVLVAARAGQGVFGALLAPAALGLLTSIFTDPAERGKAFGVFGAIAGGGGALGLILGGVLTETLSWRWSLYVNLVIAVPATVVAVRLLIAERLPARPPIDVPGVLLATSGLFALVYGFSNSEMESWGHPVTIVMLSAAAVLLTAFVWVEARAAHPLLPLRVITDRTRGGSYAAIGIAGIAMFAVFLFLTYFLQRNKGFTPIESGFAFLPMMVTVVGCAVLANTRLLPRFGPRPLIITGMSLGALGMAYLAQLEQSSGYAAGVLPGLLIMGAGMANIMAPAIATATHRVDPGDAGVASAMVNTMQQVGGSIGTALLSSIFASSVTGYGQGRPRTPEVLAEASVHGYTVAFWIAAAVFAAGALVVGSTMRSVRVAEPGAEPALAH